MSRRGQKPGATEGPEEPITIRKRKHERKPYFSVVDYAIDENTYTDFIHNISPGGVFIGTGKPFAVGDEVSMVFPLPILRENVRITGEVVWGSEMGIGVKFKSVDEKERNMLQSLVDMI